MLFIKEHLSSHNNYNWTGEFIFDGTPPAAMPPAETPRRSSTFELCLPPIQRINKKLFGSELAKGKWAIVFGETIVKMIVFP